jgi:uncharacterized protein (TIGR03437 family)
MAPVVDSVPGIFTQNGSGQGAAAALNQDYSLNTASTPAAKGSIISVYATGEGLTTPPGIDGMIAGGILTKPIPPVTATINGEPAEVLYAGGAPLEVAGVLQVNVRIPVTAESGSAVAIQIQGGDNISLKGVTIAVE